jgi:hypothetical protein
LPELLNAGVKVRSIEAYRCQGHLPSGPILGKVVLGEYLKRILVGLGRLIEERRDISPAGASGLILQDIARDNCVEAQSWGRSALVLTSSAFW